MSCTPSDRSSFMLDVRNLQNALNSLADAVACERVCLPTSNCDDKPQDVPVLFLGGKSSGKSSLMNTLLFDDCDSLALTPDTLMCAMVRSASQKSIDGQTYDSDGKFDSDLQERLKRGPPKSSQEVEEPQVVDVTTSFSDQSLCFDTCCDTSNAARFLDTPGITDAASLAGLQKMIQRLSCEGPAPILVCCVPVCGLDPREHDNLISEELQNLLTRVDVLGESQVIFVGTGYDELVKEKNGSWKGAPPKSPSRTNQHSVADAIFVQWSDDLKKMFPGAAVVRFARYGASITDNKQYVPDDTRRNFASELRVEISEAIKRAHWVCVPTVARHISSAAWADARRLELYHKLHSHTSGDVIEDFVPVSDGVVKKVIEDALGRYDEHCRDCLLPSVRALVKRKAEIQRQEQDGKWCCSQGQYQTAVMKQVSVEVDRLVKKETVAAKKYAVQKLETGLMKEIRKCCQNFDGDSVDIEDVEAEATLKISTPSARVGDAKAAGALVATGFGIRLSLMAGPLAWKLSGGSLAVVSAATSMYSKFGWKFAKVDTAMTNCLENDVKNIVSQERQALNDSLEALVGRFSTALRAMRSKELGNVVNLISQIDAYHTPPEEGLSSDPSPESVNKENAEDSLTTTTIPQSSVKGEGSFMFWRRICFEFCFDTTVQRPEFQVEWQDDGPVVACVNPGGEADRQGMLAGDSIAFVNGREVAGNTHEPTHSMRDELLDKLKERPLTLDLKQLVHVDSKHPYIEIKAKFNAPWDLGMDICWGSSLPVVGAVRKGSRAWNEGVCVGDAIHAVNGLDAINAHRSIQIALQQRPLTLTLWRRPIGADITAPWNELVQAQALTGRKKKRIIDVFEAEGSFTYRRRVCFDSTVKRAGCEIEWQEFMPVVTSIKLHGEAHQRGLLVGDRIVWTNGNDAIGKTREELLPKLMERPLTLEFDRIIHSESKHPLVEVNVQFDDVPGDLGMDISWEGSLPVICAVREGSAAWTQGAFVGDAIHSVNDLGAAAAHRFIITALQQRPLKLTLWRRPVGTDINASWKEHLRAQSPASHLQMTKCEELEEVIAAQSAELASKDTISVRAREAAREVIMESERQSESKYNELLEQVLENQKQMAKQKEQLQAVRTAVLSLNKRLLTVLDGQVSKNQQESARTDISNSSDQPYVPTGEEEEPDQSMNLTGRSTESGPGHTKEATRAAISKLATATVLLKYCKHSTAII